MSSARVRVVLGAMIVAVAAIVAFVQHEFGVEDSPHGIAGRVQRPSETETRPESDGTRLEKPSKRSLAAVERAEGDHEPVAPSRAAAPIVARGRVTLEGDALPGQIEVYLCDPDGGVLALATTDTTGAFELRCAAPLDDGWFVRTDTRMRTARGAFAALAPDGTQAFTARACTDAPRELALDARFPLVITGRVLDSATGRPIESAELRASSDEPNWAREESPTRSDADGRFRLTIESLPPSRTIVSCSAPGWEPQSAAPSAELEFALGVNTVPEQFFTR